MFSDLIEGSWWFRVTLFLYYFSSLTSIVYSISLQFFESSLVLTFLQSSLQLNVEIREQFMSNARTTISYDMNRHASNFRRFSEFPKNQALSFFLFID